MTVTGVTSIDLYRRPLQGSHLGRAGRHPGDRRLGRLCLLAEQVEAGRVPPVPSLPARPLPSGRLPVGRDLATSVAAGAR